MARFKFDDLATVIEVIIHTVMTEEEEISDIFEFIEWLEDEERCDDFVDIDIVTIF